VRFSLVAVRHCAAANEGGAGGHLVGRRPLSGSDVFEPFAQGLRDLGYVEGQNIAFERRSSEGKNEILPSLAAELVRLQPDVILAVGTPATRAVRIATQTIPIVFARITDPIGLGFVAALARPGGNLTGVSLQARELEGKRLEFLITAVPDAKHVGVLWDPSLPSGVSELREVESVARSVTWRSFDRRCVIPTILSRPYGRWRSSAWTL
jgi:putative ABC transport system substrate-binding protein